MNNISLIGRLTRDIELRYTTSGMAVAKFTIAVKRQFAKEGQQDTDFIDIVTFQKTAENCAKYLAKGSLCAVEGRLQIRPYEDKDGAKRKATEVFANNVQFLSPKKEGGQAPSAQDNTFGEQVSFDDDDIPF